jgi:hypothetical protein
MGRIASFFFPLAFLLLVFLTVCLLAPYNPDVYRAGDSQWTTLEGQQSLQSRLGYASLLAAGFVADTGSPYSVAIQKPPCEGMGPAIPGKIPLGGEEALDVGNLALALVAAEQYNRTAVRRFIERLYAVGIYGLTGGLPDISLGPAQIRPSAMREIDPTATDAAILDSLGSECGSLSVASRLVARYAQDAVAAKKTTLDEVIAAVAGRYVGIRKNASVNQRYIGIVAAAYSLLAQSAPG